MAVPPFNADRYAELHSRFAVAEGIVSRDETGLSADGDAVFLRTSLRTTFTIPNYL